MNENILDSVGNIDEDMIEGVDVLRQKRRAKTVRAKWGAIAACLCLLAVGVLSTHLIKAPNVDPDTKHDAEIRPNNAPTVTGDPVQKGIFIPAVELPDVFDEGIKYDMVGTLVYKGGIYVQSAFYSDGSDQKIDALVGEYLGYATGTLDEWSKQDEYAKEFASTYTGTVYSVNGYDTDFRVCIRHEVEGEDGEPVTWTVFLDRLNGITVSTGKDLFEDRLHLKDRVTLIQWQNNDDWNDNAGNIRTAAFGQNIWDAFLEAVDSGEFIDALMPDGSFYEDRPNSSIYDTPDQTHLILTMEDGTTVNLRLIGGGYVGYDQMGWWCFVKIPGEAFDAVYEACGGTHQMSK